MSSFFYLILFIMFFLVGVFESLLFVMMQNVQVMFM